MKKALGHEPLRLIRRGATEQFRTSFRQMGGSEQKYLSMNLRFGFTLIELLVVVLIIGILAAVALPQYEKAVMKVRMTQLVSIMKPLKEASDSYCMANGDYPHFWGDLDIEAPSGCTVELLVADQYIHCPKFFIDLYDGNNKNLAGYFPNRARSGYTVWLDNSPFPNRRECLAAPGDTLFAGVCQSMGGVLSTQTHATGCVGCSVYVLP